MKTAIKAILLLFVATSVGFLLVSETRNSPQDTDLAKAAAGTSGLDTSGAAAVEGPRAVAYYFHGTMRCPTCLKIERLARESIEATFAAEVEAGLIEWKSIDYDEPTHGHFVADYSLSTSTLVLASRDGAASWRKLDKTWALVDDEAGFKAYIVDAMGAVLRGEP